MSSASYPSTNIITDTQQQSGGLPYPTTHSPQPQTLLPMLMMTDGYTCADGPVFVLCHMIVYE